MKHFQCIVIRTKNIDMFYLHTYSNLHTLTSNKLHLSTECLATPPQRDNKCSARPPSRFPLSRLLRGKQSKTGRR